MPTVTPLHQAEIRFLDVPDGMLGETVGLLVEITRWGAENGAAIAVGVVLGFAVGWARGRLSAIDA